MNYLRLLILILLVPAGASKAQELFIQTEPASTMPGGVTGIRAITQVYREPGNYIRGMTALRIMHGVTPKLTVMLTATASNHHSKELPPRFPDHNTPQIGVGLPWRFNGLNLYARYRIYSNDGPKTHFRIAAYGTASWMDVAHDEGEPDLMDDTKGLGGGIITTWLRKHFALSTTVGGIVPSAYKGRVPDIIPGLPSIPAHVRYGNAVTYSLSAGYLLLPRTYKGYGQTNINLYAELLGKSYGAGKVFLENIGSGSAYQISGPALQVFEAHTYAEFHPGIQAIFGSNLRIDLSAGFPLLSRSYARFYPIYTVSVQRYFFGRDKR